MKKVSVFVLAAVLVAPSAHAGWLDSLLGRDKEPQTLAEACNTDEIKSICPEILLSDMSVTECLVQNVKKLSGKCAAFVKKQATDKINAVRAQVAASESDAANAAANSATAAKIEQARADAAQAAAAVQEVKDTAKETADSLKETGAGLVNIFKAREE